MKSALLTLFCLIGFCAISQDVERQVRQIRSVADADNFVKFNRKLRAEVLEVSAMNEVGPIEEKLLAKKAGAVLKHGGYLYKVLESTVVHSFRVSNIFLNGKVLSLESIDSVRKTIIDRYRNGTPFTDLVRIYNMDSNPTGDVGWFSEGMMVTEFEEAVRAHKKNDIFTIDVPDQGWYYVTLKTHEDRRVKLVTVLKVDMD